MKLDLASIVDGEPGYTQYSNARAEGRKVEVTLDGVEQKLVVAANAIEGWVRKAIVKHDGSIAHDGENFLEETLRGEVVIEVEETL